MKNGRLVLAVVVVCALLPSRAKASMIAFEGHAPGELNNILFNEAGLIDSGLTVTGITADSAMIVSFIEDSTSLATPSAGQARVAGEDGATFDWLTVMPIDPLAQFLQFEANVNLSGPATVQITAFGSTTSMLNFVGSNGENRFAVTADAGDWISWILIQTPGGNFMSDVRQIRFGTAGSDAPVGALMTTPEPGTLIMLATGLFAVARQIRRRRTA